MYVPKLLALVEIVADPAKYNLTLPVVPNEPQFVVADIGRQLDLALAAELAGVDVDTVYQYNPGYNRWSTDPSGPHQLVMPIDVAEQFYARWHEVPTIERVRWQRHKVKNGEAISQIAENYNTTVPAIRAANNLRGNTIRAGHHLMIPVATKPLSAYSKSADARLAKTQNRKRAGNKVEHIVRSGESFWTISQTLQRHALARSPPGTAWRRATRCRLARNSSSGRSAAIERRARHRPRRSATPRAN